MAETVAAGGIAVPDASDVDADADAEAAAAAAAAADDDDDAGDTRHDCNHPYHNEVT